MWLCTVEKEVNHGGESDWRRRKEGAKSVTVVVVMEAIVVREVFGGGLG